MKVRIEAMRDYKTDPRIKLCGLRFPEDVEAVNEIKPDYAGFIVSVPKSFRSVSEEQLRMLTQSLDPSICAVGVFVDAPIAVMERLLADNVIEIAQLHGQESPEVIRELKRRTGRPVIKAFSIRTSGDIETALQSPADYILLDQGSGGTGEPFDWSMVPAIDRPWFLAGGLGIGNLRQAVDQLHPWAVDMSSSLETNQKKDKEKMRRAVSLVRQRGE